MRQAVLRRVAAVSALALLGVALAQGALAQGAQVGSLTGTVKSADGQTVPGVSVTLTSPVLQGQRQVVSDSNGGFVFRGLAPGEYTVSFSISGFATLTTKRAVGLGLTEEVSAVLKVAAMEETLEVRADLPSILGTTVVGASYRADDIDKLATGRTIQNIAALSPGLTTNTPNAGQLSIAGGFAYDNVFLLNGVDINDNLFGSGNNLFIEDAVDQIQVLTSGISAEYGRFSGGVVNAVTKRGGNDFHGSFRTDFTNSAWQDESKFEKEQIALGRGTPHLSKTNRIYQATLGGPILKDRIWFFGAARREQSSTAFTLSNTGIPYNRDVKNPRYEGKLTGSINKNHTLTGSFVENETEQINNPSINATASIDPRTLVARTLPNSLLVANYNGVLTSNLFAEAQYSQKKQGFRNTGGTSTNILDSPFMSQGRTGLPSGRHYNAPYFDSNDPEDRNNRQYTASLSYFLSTSRAGRHDLKIGGENYTSWRTGGNSQSSTGFVFLTDPVMAGTSPLIDSGGRIQPTWVPGVTQVQNWIPVRGAQINLHTMSLYLNDRWQFKRWAISAGARYEKHTADTTQAGVVTPESSSLVPRVGATYDVKGDGVWILQATYGHYAGKSSETQVADNTNVGSPNRVTSQYNGPAGTGLGFAPGFDLSNYSVVSGSFPVKNVFMDAGLATPLTKEWTLQAGRRLGNRGDVKFVYVHRNTGDLLDDFITLDRGRTTVVENGRTFGTFDNSFITNTDLPFRRYQGLTGQVNYRPTERWTFSANYTMQIKNEGNFEGEAANQPGNYSIIGNQPEFYTAERHYPEGRLDQYQKHKFRLFANLDQKIGRFGRANVGLIYRYDSPIARSLTAANVPITAIQRAKDPGYANVPTTQTLFFGERGSYLLERSHLVDVAVNYDLPSVRTARLWVKAEVRNAFNSQPNILADLTITPNNAGPLDANGLATEFVKGVNFGKATVLTHNPRAREILVSAGVRF